MSITSSKLTQKTVTKNLVLVDLDAEWYDDWGYPTEVIKAGSRVRVHVTAYADGRVYYTAFALIADRLYTYTSMKDRDGKVYPNTGDGPVSRAGVCKALGIDYHRGPGARPKRILSAVADRVAVAEMAHEMSGDENEFSSEAD